MKTDHTCERCGRRGPGAWFGFAYICVACMDPEEREEAATIEDHYPIDLQEGTEK